MKVIMWSDFVCPFCYIGGAHLEQAMADLDFGKEIEIEYKSYLLNPNAQYDPNKTYTETLATDKGMPVVQAKQMFERVIEMGQAAGLNIDFDKAKYAATQDAHRVFQYAKEVNKGVEFFERFYQAHFTEGENISDGETIVRLAIELELDENKVRSILASDAYEEVFHQDIQQAQMTGVQGVPFFVIDNKYAVSGAQPVELFKQALTQAWTERTED